VKQEKKSSTNLVLAMRMTVHGNQHTKDGPKHTVWPRKMRLVTELLILNIIDAQAQLNHTCPQGGASDVAFRASNSGCAFWLNGEPPALSITGNCDDCTYSRDTVTGNLHEICLPQRGIASIVNGTFDGMPSMMKLRLGWNEIIEFSSGTFSHNLSLLDLDHRDTQIAKHHFDTFHHNAALEQIRLSFNPTTKLHSDIFKHKDEI